jgi:hypothetical protein
MTAVQGQKSRVPVRVNQEVDLARGPVPASLPAAGACAEHGAHTGEAWTLLLASASKAPRVVPAKLATKGKRTVLDARWGDFISAPTAYGFTEPE